MRGGGRFATSALDAVVPVLVAVAVAVAAAVNASAQAFPFAVQVRRCFVVVVSL